MLEGKTLTDYTNPISLHHFEKNNKIILNFMKSE